MPDHIYTLKTDLMTPEEAASVLRDLDGVLSVVVPGKPRNTDGSKSVYFAADDPDVALRVPDLIREGCPHEDLDTLPHILKLNKRIFTGWATGSTAVGGLLGEEAG